MNLLSSKTLVNLTYYREYINLYNKFNNRRDISGFLREWYEKLFNEFPPWDKQALSLIHLKIGYKLIAMQYREAGVEMPKKYKQNYKASKYFKVDEFTKSMQQILHPILNHELKKGEEKMAKKKAVKKVVKKKAVKKKLVIKKSAKKEKLAKPISKTKKFNMGLIYLDIFTKQAKNKLSDTQIAELIKKKTGTLPMLYSVASFRSKYNAGKLPGQTEAPKEKVRTFNKIGVPGRSGNADVKKARTKKLKKVIKKRIKRTFK